jgi:alkylation response protein AidB-like acyl-CoA dehydrogenase
VVKGFFGKLGVDSCDLAEIHFDVELESEALLVKPGLGLIYAMHLLEMERISVCAQLIALTHSVLGMAAVRAKHRVQFGSTLSQHQAWRHRLAELTADLWSAESFLSSILLAAQSGRETGSETAALKLLCARLAQRATDECLQLFGARGYTTNYPLERIWRDVRVARIGAGTDEVMLEIVAKVLDKPTPALTEYVEHLEQSESPITESDSM